MQRPNPFKVSLVAPFYNEADTITRFFDAVIPILQQFAHWEIICVDDGSADETMAALTAQHVKYNNVRIISFARNFGKEIALSASLDFTDGDVVIPIDADLQDPPEMIPAMIQKWQEGYDVVLAVRHVSKEVNTRTVLARLFYTLMGAIAEIDIRANTGDFRLMDRKVITVIRQMKERTRFMKGIMSWAGFKTTEIYFDRAHRIQGKTRWSAINLCGLALDGIFSFSEFPIRFWSYIGFAISSICALLLLLQSPSENNIVTFIFLALGINLLAIGTLGEYITRIYKETRQRPLYVISKTIGF